MDHTIMPKSNGTPTQASAAELDARDRERGVNGAAMQSTPKMKRQRRNFSAGEKLRIVRKADACLASGERGALGAMLRQEGVYSSQLSTWRRQLHAAGTSALSARKPGRKPKLSAQDKVLAELKRRNAELERKLHIAEALIDLQKKAHAVLGIALPEPRQSEDAL